MTADTNSVIADDVRQLTVSSAFFVLGVAGGLCAMSRMLQYSVHLNCHIFQCMNDICFLYHDVFVYTFINSFPDFMMPGGCGSLYVGQCL